MDGAGFRNIFPLIGGRDAFLSSFMAATCPFVRDWTCMV